MIEIYRASLIIAHGYVMRLEEPPLSRPGRQAGTESGKQGERRRCGTNMEGLVPRFQRSSFVIILSRPDGRAY
jgi:hypothetical protein